MGPARRGAPLRRRPSTNFASPWRGARLRVRQSRRARRGRPGWRRIQPHFTAWPSAERTTVWIRLMRAAESGACAPTVGLRMVSSPSRRVCADRPGAVDARKTCRPRCRAVPDVQRHIAGIRGFANAGFTHLALVQVGGDTQEQFISWAASELLPAAPSWLTRPEACRVPCSMAATDARGAWAPLRREPFRALWIALFRFQRRYLDAVSGCRVGDGVDLKASPTEIALVQTATTLPVVFFGVIGGALADLVDRRRVLLVTQAIMMVAAGALALLDGAGTVTPISLLVLTFALGVGTAPNNPAWQAIQPELVPR